MNKQMSKMVVWAVVAAVMPVAAVTAQQQAAGGGVQATLAQEYRHYYGRLHTLLLKPGSQHSLQGPRPHRQMRRPQHNS